MCCIFIYYTIENQIAIVFSYKSAQEKTAIFTVEAVGADVKTVKKGDRILYNGYTSEFKYDGVDYLIIKEEDILATV